MEWLDNLWDGIGNLFDSKAAPTFIERNWDKIEKVAGGANKVYNAIDMNNAEQKRRSGITDLMAKLGAEEDAYNKQVYDWQNANAASRAAAARANDAARRKAANKAFGVQKKMLNSLIAQYQPYADAAKTLTPKMAQNYGQFLDTTALLNQYLSPKVMQTFGEAPKPASQQAIAQPTFANNAGQVSFPDVEKILGWNK
jgi:hypothetical protein